MILDGRGVFEVDMDNVRLQFQALLPLSVRHRPWVDAMSMRFHELPARATLLRADGVPQRLYFVAKGWLGGASAFTAQNRPFNALRIRGDVIGLPWIGTPNQVEDVITITPCELISVPSQQFRNEMRVDPILQEYVFSELVRDMMNLRLMNAVIGHMKAPDRLAYFLYMMLLRCRRTYRTHLQTVSIPMTQEEIGQILGLTNVSVNRAFRTLEADDLIQTNRHSITFMDEIALLDRLDLNGRSDLLGQLAGTETYYARTA